MQHAVYRDKIARHCWLVTPHVTDKFLQHRCITLPGWPHLFLSRNLVYCFLANSLLSPSQSNMPPACQDNHFSQ